MLSENIKILRKQKGYSQEQLAEKLNVVRQTVSKWEKGYSVPDADVLEELADIFEVSVGNLLGKEIMTEEETTDIGELVKQLKILNDYFSERVRRKKKAKKMFKGFCNCIGIVAIIFCMYLCIGFVVSQWNEVFKNELTTTLAVTFEDKEYEIKIRSWEHNDEIHAINWSNGMPETVNEMLKSQDCFEKSPEELVAELENYFTENGGSCEITNGKLTPVEKIIEENL